MQDNEAGGITQQIGATNVPKDTILEQAKMVKDVSRVFSFPVPGLRNVVTWTNSMQALLIHSVFRCY